MQSRSTLHSRVHWLAAALLLGTALPAAAAPVPVSGDPVLYWNQLLVQTLFGPPEPTGRAYAIVDTAIHDAVNATVGYKNRNYLGHLVSAGGDTRAAASVAAHNALVALDPGNAATYDAALTASLALVPNGTAKTKGIATGGAYAAAALANRASDGSFANVPYTPTGLPGHWAPTPPIFIPAVDSQWGASTPWLLASGDQFRPGPPPALTSAEYTAAFNASKEIGSATSGSRTADQTFSANFWAADTGGAPWAQAAIAGSQAQGLTTLQNAQLFARLSVAQADAIISVFNTKYYHDFWRPVTAIQLADTDGNPATDADPAWQPLLFTPPFPSYTSAHAENAGAAAAILNSVFGTSTGFCLTDVVGDRCWSSYDAAALDAANSRIWGGIHWSFDGSAGLTSGYDVGRYALAQGAFAPVPEPAALALFGLGAAALVRLRARPRRSR